VNSVNAQW
jgi:hypothetical protein